MEISSQRETQTFKYVLKIKLKAPLEACNINKNKSLLVNN